jgi:hypothetical protein
VISVPREPALSPEARLLVSTTACPPDRAALRRLAKAGIDWARFYDLAAREGASPIALPVLAALGPDGPPPAHAQRLDQAARAWTVHLLKLEQLLDDVLDTLAPRGIEVVLLKGAAVARATYRSFAERPMSDLDLLVPPDRAADAWSRLIATGWTPWMPSRPPGRYAAHHHLPPLVRSDAPSARVEIHRDLLPPGHGFRLAAAAVRAAAQPVDSRGRRALVPHPVHRLLHVCLHFAWSHEMQWGAWRALRDVTAIAARGEVDWPDFIALARETRGATCCFWTLRLARRLAGAAIPDRVCAALRPPGPGAILDALERHYTSNLFPSEPKCPSVRLANLLWAAGIRPGWSGHGTARPWHVSARWRPAVGGGSGDGTDDGAPPCGPAAWRAYLHRVFVGGGRHASCQAEEHDHGFALG